MAGTAQEGVELLPHQTPAACSMRSGGARCSRLGWRRSSGPRRSSASGMSHPLDPIALLLRLLALSSSLRALLALGLLAAPRARARPALALSARAVRTRDSCCARRAPTSRCAKDDIVDIRERGAWQDRGGAALGRRVRDHAASSGRLYLAIPPLFERSVGALAERLMRWRGATAGERRRGRRVEREPAELPSKLFDAVAAGERPPGVAVIEHGRGWMQARPVRDRAARARAARRALPHASRPRASASASPRRS